MRKNKNTRKETKKRTCIFNLGAVGLVGLSEFKINKTKGKAPVVEALCLKSSNLIQIHHI